MLVLFHFIINTSDFINFLRSMCLFFTFDIWFCFSWKFFCQFTSRSSASEEDDKEDSVWEPQKKVSRSRKQPAPKDSKPKRVPRIKNTPQISDGTGIVDVKEEPVGAVAR